MAAFDFAVVSGGEGSDTLVTDAEIREGFLEHRREGRFRGVHLIGKLRAIVSLYAFNRERKLLNTMADKNR